MGLPCIHTSQKSLLSSEIWDQESWPIAHPSIGWWENNLAKSPVFDGFKHNRCFQWWYIWAVLRAICGNYYPLTGCGMYAAHVKSATHGNSEEWSTCPVSISVLHIQWSPFQSQVLWSARPPLRMLRGDVIEQCQIGSLADQSTESFKTLDK